MQIQRAYSLLTIKGLDDDRRELTGIASTPETDRMGDIVDPSGAEFAEEIPLLWQHNHSMPVGHARLKKGDDGIGFSARLARVMESGRLKSRLDEAWQSVKAGLIRGVSIGFRPHEYNQLDDGGLRFVRYEIYELSLVTIPANASATITSVKSFARPDVVRLIRAPHPDLSTGAVRLIRAGR